MKLGRVIKRDEIGETSRTSTTPQSSRTPRGRAEPRVVVEAADRARQIVQEATAQAEKLKHEAAKEAATIRLSAEEQGRADAVAALAAKAVRLADLEGRADERSLDRAVSLARVLAERLLGEELRLDPSRIVDLAKQALSEAKGARRIGIAAHPEDAVDLERSLASLGLDGQLVEIHPDPERARGSLRLDTEIGVLDASLAPQLDRLAKKLRESLEDDR